jgi:hypothetical protein
LGAAGGTAYWLTAVAAVLLIVFGIALVRAKLSPTKLSTQSGPDSVQSMGVKTPAQDPITVVKGENEKGSVESVPASVSTAKDNHELAVHGRRRRSQQLRRRPVNRDGDVDASLSASSAAAAGLQPTAEQTEPEVATQFIALSYVAPANLQDGGQIVRVELPRSAMASFGLPVNMDRFGERVKADVLVSADGFARAIRFVQ